MHREELLVAACFYDAFASVVNHDGALLRLLVGMAADVHQSLDDVVESVVIVVVEHQFAAVVVQDVNILFLLSFIFLVVLQC